MGHATIDRTLHLHGFGDQSVTKLRVDGVGALDPNALAGRGIAMLGVSHIPMQATPRSDSLRYSRIAWAHPVRFAVLAGMLSMPLAGQTGIPLTLPKAVSMALGKNPLHKAAVADIRVSSAVIREARSQLMPKIMFTESAARGNDPVFVFGSRLRQQNFTLADFALNRLNTPFLARHRVPMIDGALPVYCGDHYASVSGFVTGRAETNRVNEIHLL